MASWSDEQRALLQKLVSSGIGRENIIAQLQSDLDAEHLAGIGAGEVVMLSGGQGRKAEHNGKRARLLGPVGKGGWVEVVTDPPQPARVKWRSQAWRLGDAPARLLPLLTTAMALPDSLWLHALGFLGGALPGCGAGALLSLREAARLHAQLALVSRRFRSLPCAAVVGGVDVDLLGVEDSQALAALVFAGARRLKVGRLRVYHKTDDTGLVVWLLRRCDTDRTREVIARTEANGYHDARGSAIVRAAYYSSCVPHVDLTTSDDHSGGALDVTAMMAQLGVLPKLELADLAQLIKGKADLIDAIAAECPRIVRLDVNIYKGELARSTDQPFARSLRELRLGLPCFSHEDSLIAGHHEMVSNIPNLEVLQLFAGWDRSRDEFLQAGDRFSWAVRSSTLQVLDLTGSFKGFGIHECVCPVLERFVCRGAGYGNGIRPVDTSDDAESSGLLWHQKHTQGSMAFGDAADGFCLLQLDGTIQHDEPVVMDVPGTCILEFKGYPGDHASL